MASGASFSSRAAGALSSAWSHVASLPPVTLGFTALLVLAHVLRLILRIGVLAWCLDVRYVIKKHQLWRLLSGVFTHLGVFHLMLNAWGITLVAADREREAGSGVLLLELVFLALSSGAAFVLGGEGIHDLLDEIKALNIKIEVPRPACAAGASGVALGLLAAAAGSPGAPGRFDFGGFSLPGRLRPWLLAAAIQLMVPEVSLAGHVSGLLCGEVVGWARRSASARERVGRAGGAVDGLLRAPVALARSLGGRAASDGGVGASLLPVSGGGENSSNDKRGLGARFAALFKGRGRSGWQALAGDEAAPRGRTTGTAATTTERAAAATMTAAEAARAAAEARAAAAAAAAVPNR